MPSLTVIIATYNRARLLKGALDALASQDDPGVPVAILIADNGSTDQTRAVFEEARRRVRRFEWQYVLEPRPGKSHAVNAALARADGEWLAFTDDDVRPEPGWLAAIARAFATSDADFVVGRILPIWQAPAPAWLTPALYGVLGIPDNGPAACRIGIGENEHVMAIGTNMAVRSAAVERVGGLRPELGKMRGTLRTGEDHEFYLRLLHHGCRGVYAPDALVRHLVSADRLERAYFRRWFYQNGRNVAALQAEYPARAPTLLKVPRYKWREAAAHAGRLITATVRLDEAARFRGSVALLWMAGYLRERWFGAARRRTPTAQRVNPGPPSDFVVTRGSRDTADAARRGL